MTRVVSMSVCNHIYGVACRAARVHGVDAMKGEREGPCSCCLFELGREKELGCCLREGEREDRAMDSCPLVASILWVPHGCTSRLSSIPSKHNYK